MENCDLQKVAIFDKKFATCDLLDGSFPGWEPQQQWSLGQKARTVYTELSGMGRLELKH